MENVLEANIIHDQEFDPFIQLQQNDNPFCYWEDLTLL